MLLPKIHLGSLPSGYQKQLAVFKLVQLLTFLRTQQVALTPAVNSPRLD